MRAKLLVLVLAVAAVTTITLLVITRGGKPPASQAATRPATRAANRMNWNDAQVAWQGYDTGLALAKRSHEPICLIFYTTWCPHCHHYSHVFSDPKVVQMAKHFVMIRLDKDKNAALSKKYDVDGEYIPRTFFLDEHGKILKNVHAPRQRYRYFYDERNPASVLAGMKAALAAR